MSSLKEIYNNLEDVYDVNARVKARPKVIDDLANILVAAGLNGQYDIRLIHKHFDIEDGEQVVAFDGNDAKVSVVCKNGEAPLETLDQYGVKPMADAAIIPTDFLINEAGAVPYEFSYSSVPMDGKALELPTDFLKKWTHVLNEYDLFGVLGLAIQEGMPVGGHEMSDGTHRVNKLSFGDMPPESSPGFATTSWRATNLEGTVQVMKCTYCQTTTTRHNCA